MGKQGRGTITSHQSPVTSWGRRGERGEKEIDRSLDVRIVPLSRSPCQQQN
ncbi:MAG: hypothetical protein AB4290_18395 [Spirulina sp.]